MKKLIMKSLLVFAMLAFVASPAMAAKPEDVIDNKSNVLPGDKLYAMNMTGKSDKKATATTELQTTDPDTPVSDGNDININMEQLKMILLILCMPGPWQGIAMNIQLQ
jgi:hypothetical protein